MADFATYLEHPSGWLVLGAIIFLLLMTNACHEGGHALAAWWGGDRRPSLRRRVTLNPIRHFHWLLTLVLPVVALVLSQGTMIFGGARPVLIDRGALGRRRMALAALAGPTGNFLFAGFAIVVLGLAVQQRWFGIEPWDVEHAPVWTVLKVTIWFSAFLGLLNLLPLPGLDGGHVVGMCLPEPVQRVWYWLTPLGILSLLALLLYFGGFTWKWGWTGPPPQPTVFTLLDGRVRSYIFGMRDFWGSVL